MDSNAPRIETGIPDQHGAPGFYLYLPMVDFEGTKDELHQVVPAERIAWSAEPPAFWIPDGYRTVVRDFVMGRFGYCMELSEQRTIRHHFWRGEGAA